MRSSDELEEETTSDDKEGEGDGVKIVWMAVVSTVNDDVMSKTLDSRGSPLPLPVIPALGGEGQRGYTQHT